jgi:hypothetical protein
LLSFPTFDHRVADGIDENANSDEYSVFSTWTIEYWSGYIDDDAEHRITKYWYMASWSGFQSIFWNNTKATNIIEANVNNTGSYYAKIWTWFLYLSIDEDVSMRMYTFDKAVFDLRRELVATGWVIIDTAVASGIWYIDYDWTNVTLTALTWANTVVFDFLNFDYALLLENESGNVLGYSLKWFDSTSWSGMYIVPIDDSDKSSMVYLSNSIVLNDKKSLIYEEKEVLSSK